MNDRTFSARRAQLDARRTTEGPTSGVQVRAEAIARICFTDNVSINVMQDRIDRTFRNADEDTQDAAQMFADQHWNDLLDERAERVAALDLTTPDDLQALTPDDRFDAAGRVRGLVDALEALAWVAETFTPGGATGAAPQHVCDVPGSGPDWAGLVALARNAISQATGNN